MKATNTGEVLPNVYAISNLQVCFYILKTNQTYIAFDAGGKSSMTVSELSRLNIRPEDVAAVFLTHTDSDHVAALGLFTQAKVYISKREEQLINGSVKRSLFMDNKLHCPYETLDDGDTIEVDSVSVKCMITPGHTIGSVCYIVDGKYLFSGDNFGIKNDKATLFIRFFNMDSNEQKKSIKKIAGLQGIEAILTAHHGYSLDFTGVFKDWQG